MAETGTRRRSSFAGTQLGYKDGTAVKADAHLKELGAASKEAHRRASLTNDQRPGFDHSPIRYVHKFTDVKEYNALADPLLEAHFISNPQIQKNLVSQALLTPDGFVLHTEKKAHIQRHIGAVTRDAGQAMDKLEQQRRLAKETAKKSFKELCDAKLNNWRAVQVSESEMVEAIKSKVDANRVSVADAPLTEQGRLYVEEKKAEFEDHADLAELRRFELEAERKVKLAIKEKRLRAERTAKRAALEEAIEVQEAELAMVKQNIVNTNDTKQKTMAKIKEDTLKKQHKATNEANEFKRHMTTVFAEREQKQQEDITTRKECAAIENAQRIAKRDAELAAKEARRLRQIAIETEAREKKLAEMREEDRLRKIKQMEEKEARKEAKRKFLVQQQEKARENKMQAEQERMHAKEAEARFVKEQDDIRESRRQKNMEEKEKRAEAMAKAQAEAAALKKFEADMARTTQANELAAAEKEFKAEQERLWQQALDEEMLRERARQQEAAIAAKKKLAVEEELAREAAHKEAMEKKAADEKVAKNAAKKIKLKKAKEEMNRRIEYMKKFGV